MLALAVSGVGLLIAGAAVASLTLRLDVLNRLRDQLAQRPVLGGKRVHHLAVEAEAAGLEAVAGVGRVVVLDQLERAQALEEALRVNGAKVASLAPSIIDTDMQVQLRGADPAGFPGHDAFMQMKAGGRLDSPATAAAKGLAYLRRADFGGQPVADVRDA